MTSVIDAPVETLVTLYTQPGCGPCVGVEQYLKRSGVDYVKRNIREDEDALARVAELGYTGTPVVEHPGGHFKGYDPDELAKLKLF